MSLFKRREQTQPMPPEPEPVKSPEVLQQQMRFLSRLRGTDSASLAPSVLDVAHMLAELQRQIDELKGLNA